MGRRNGKKSLKSQVNKLKFQVGRLNNSIERKAISQTALAGEPVDTTGFTQHISETNQGITDLTRIGDSIRVKTLMIRGIIDNKNGTPVDSLVRLLVYKNMVPNGVPQVIAGEVLEAIGINRFQDWAKKDIYKVYYDNTFFLDTALHSKIPFKIRVAGLNSKTTYEGTGASEADAMTNHYYFSFFGDAATSANTPTIDARFRMTFEDA